MASRALPDDADGKRCDANALLALQEIFPTSESSLLIEALHRGGGIQEAASLLLHGGTAENTRAGCAGRPSLPPVARPGGTTTNTPTDGTGGKYVPVPASLPNVDRTSSCPSAPRPGQTQHRCGNRAAPERLADQAGQRHPPAGWSHFTALHRRGAIVRPAGLGDSAVVSSASLATGILVRQYPWAGAEIIEAVLESTHGHLVKAAEVLEEMAPAGGNEPTAGSEGRAAASTLSTSTSGSSDGYWTHRKEAVRLGRELRKVQRQAQAARHVGDESQGGAYEQQSRQLEKRVRELHLEAAARIEAQNNGYIGEWPHPLMLDKLDLHGLHVEEALSALESRLSFLEAHINVKGVPRRLNVIIGRGRHSSHSEASIPRATEGYLQQRGNNFSHSQIGCLEVRVRHVRRP
mmetsp:Transcript_15803/g.44220  ORF Transcript_15803/g.44220 Transcript_15803/m.44220 type:complete len:406 (+) Transcript_15803:291-1508(+)|eukprot:CAMPEP_0117658256 /NCGR_PEP_ID=MMETSP0804-20121206/5768_1 /TAXON_ID=1074897 /ORGANISM="Tetraselmis astigmatica, Strain CCMP880" /LENGTH=405 /DNA_ID=CAMNT_0005464767 /DNA_START=280 /DNA_END=1497 /DNA_ORIENTATION=-